MKKNLKPLILFCSFLLLLLPLLTFAIPASASVPETLLPLITTARNIDGGILIEWTDPNMGTAGYSRDYYVMARYYDENTGWSEWRCNQAEWDGCGFSSTGGDLTIWEGNVLWRDPSEPTITFRTGNRYQFSAIAANNGLLDPTELSPINPSNEIVMLTIDCVYTEVAKDYIRVMPGQNGCTNCFYRREKTDSGWSEWEELACQQNRVYADYDGLPGKTYQYGVIKKKDGFESILSVGREVVYPAPATQNTTTTTTLLKTTTTTATATTTTTSETITTEAIPTGSLSSSSTTSAVAQTADSPSEDPKRVGGWLIFSIVLAALMLGGSITVAVLLLKNRVP